MMNRRRLLGTLSTGLLAGPLVTKARAAGNVHRISSLSSAANIFEPFRRGLRELGYIEGQNLVIEARLAAGKIDRLPVLAAELVRTRVVSHSKARYDGAAIGLGRDADALVYWLRRGSEAKRNDHNGFVRANTPLGSRARRRNLKFPPPVVNTRSVTTGGAIVVISRRSRCPGRG